jgi:hypothetical protein
MVYMFLWDQRCNWMLVLKEPRMFIVNGGNRGFFDLHLKSHLLQCK